VSEADLPTLSIDDDAVVWSIPRDELPTRVPGSPLLVIMHGRGSHERDLVSLVPYLPAGVVCASLRAPMVAPAPIVDGFTWFAAGEPGAPDPASATASTLAVLAWLDRVSSRYGDPAAVSALGFSQGGAMSLQLIRHAPSRFASAVNLSGFSLPGEAPGDTELLTSRPRVFWGRDAADPVIPASAIARTGAWLPDHANVTERLYAGIQHGIGADEIADVREFLEETLVAAAADRESER
jgi:phospholipase/carboxylesterase